MKPVNSLADDGFPTLRSTTLRDEFHAINSYIEKIRSHPILSMEDETRFCLLAHQGDENSRKRLILSNLRQVVKIARKYYNRNTSLLDLVEDGNRGLARAVEKFDPTRGCRFSTYAGWWIHQAIERGILTRGRRLDFQVPIIHHDR